MNEKVLSLKNKLLCIFHMIGKIIWFGTQINAFRKTQGDKNFVYACVALMHFSWRVVWEFEQNI